MILTRQYLSTALFVASATLLAHCGQSPDIENTRTSQVDDEQSQNEESKSKGNGSSEDTDADATVAPHPISGAWLTCDETSEDENGLITCHVSDPEIVEILNYEDTTWEVKPHQSQMDDLSQEMLADLDFYKHGDRFEVRMSAEDLKTLENSYIVFENPYHDMEAWERSLQDMIFKEHDERMKQRPHHRQYRDRDGSQPL